MLTKRQPTGGVVVVLDQSPNEPRDVIELKASKELKQQPPPTEPQQDRLQAAIGAAERGLAGAEAPGAAAGAGVLTAVDEDEEGGEEAPVPEEFGYETEGGDAE